MQACALLGCTVQFNYSLFPVFPILLLFYASAANSRLQEALYCKVERLADCPCVSMVWFIPLADKHEVCR